MTMIDMHYCWYSIVGHFWDVICSFRTSAVWPFSSLIPRLPLQPGNEASLLVSTMKFAIILVVCRLPRELGTCANVYQGLFSPSPHKSLGTRLVSSSTAKSFQFALLLAALHIFHSHSSQCVSVSQAMKFNFTELILNLNSGLPPPPSPPSITWHNTQSHTISPRSS